MKKKIVSIIKNNKNNSLTSLIIDISAYIAGGSIYAVAINSFTAPNNIAPGGASGAAIVLNYLYNIPIGILTIIINMPLFIIGFFKLGKKGVLKSFIVMVLSSIIIDITEPFLPVFSGNHLLAAIYGGVLIGFGLSLIFMRDATTGGTDLAARLIQQSAPHMTMGRLIMFIDLIIVAISAFVYREMESALYAIITIYVTGQIIDGIMYGMGSGKFIFVITSKYEQLSQAIMDKLQRGVTLLEAKGAYTGKPQKVIMCAVRKPEAFKIRRLINHIDPDAFIIIGEAGEILGEGFKSLE